MQPSVEACDAILPFGSAMRRRLEASMHTTANVFGLSLWTYCKGQLPCELETKRDLYPSLAWARCMQLALRAHG